VTTQPALGARLREARKRRGYSLIGTAQATGISTGFLSLVENGKHDITISRLLRLVRCYDVSLADLLAPDSERPLVLHESEQGHVRSSDESIELIALAGDGHGVAAGLAVYAPGSATSEPIMLAGDLFLYVVEGRIEVTFEDGGEPLDLGEGDSALVAAERRHSYRNTGRSRTRVLGVQLIREAAPPTDARPRPGRASSERA
jgi:transcriptional regulator with XRE-family HTH domain